VFSGNQPAALWRRSKACNPVECVEVALYRDRVMVRDSKRPGAAILEFTREEWQRFLSGLCHGSVPGGDAGQRSRLGDIGGQ
jgi:Domain of unknown function (DUF397)